MQNNEGLAGIARAMNVAANGRWGSLGMAVIALHQGQIFFAFQFVLLLLAAYVAEQTSLVARAWLGLAIAAWGAVLVVAFSVVLVWV